MKPHKVVVRDGEDVEIWTADEFENRLTRSYQVGVCAGLEQAANEVMGLATEAFKRDDDEADRLRAISRDLLTKSRAAHPGRD